MIKVIQWSVIIVMFFLSIPLKSQTDSLVTFSDLRFHSEFEESAFRNFVTDGKDTLNLFLAIDENFTEDDARSVHEIYLSIFKDLAESGAPDKKMKKKIKKIYANVHDRFLRKYSDLKFFPVIFKTGLYNCVSASMLYAMVFDELDIPYKVKASASHVYLVANPGSNSMVVETTNPGFGQQIFNGDFKRQYVNYLRSSKLISETEYKSKSVEEIFEEKFKEVKDAELSNLPGFQYYNKALYMLQNNNLEEALHLCQKAYYFFPDNQVKTLLFTCLVFHIDQCNFNKVSDIDYLSQYTRFENIDTEAFIGTYNNILYKHLQYADKDAFCDSLNNRLLSGVTDENLKREIDFTYNMQMSYRYQKTDEIEKYIIKALRIKPDFLDALRILENHVRLKLIQISYTHALVDSINQLEARFEQESIKEILLEHKKRAYLKQALESFARENMTQGDLYLQEFEKITDPPVNSPMLKPMVENAYFIIAFYYANRGNKMKALPFVNRGLKYVPYSRHIESAVLNNR